MTLTFSAITPSYSQGEFIERTILSVLTQSIPPMEYMIFDGGSKDQTVDILKKYDQKIFWVSEKDRGQTHAINKGLERASGDIIAWLNSDDIYYPDTFKRVSEFFMENPDVDIVYGNANNINKEDGIIDEYLIEPWDFERLKSHCFLSQPAVFFRRTVVERYGCLNEDLNFCMDYEYWLRLGKAGVTFGYLPVILAGSRLYGETKTLNQRLAVHREIMQMLRSKFGHVPERWCTNYAHAVLESKNADPTDRKRFVRAMILTTAMTSLRWNKKISKPLRKTLQTWIGEYMMITFPKKEKVIKEMDSTLLALFPIDTQKKRIVVDLTRLQPGGKNGGAKLMTLALIQYLSQISPEYHFFLITPSRCHDELFYLDAPNVQRLCIVQENPHGLVINTVFKKDIVQIKTSRHLVRELGADLLFNPLTEPLFLDPKTPSVSVIYDLQYAYYPQFFSEEQYQHRDRHVQDACRFSSHVVCISDYVRQTVLEKVNVSSDKISAIPIRLPHRVGKVVYKKTSKLLNRFSLSSSEFMLYPANFWRHKNHALLLDAFAYYRSQHPASSLKLVCTGAPNDAMEVLKKSAEEMKLAQWVIFPGYVSVQEFSALLSTCKAMIFPSLYEGFGMPVLEAMAFDKPVFCSNETSLPEVAGNAAFFFDPKSVDAIADAIEKIDTDAALLKTLVARGKEHVKTIEGPQEMAVRYKAVFEQALDSFAHCQDAVHGLYGDSWTNDSMLVTYQASPDKQRTLEATWHIPGFFPEEKMQIEIHESKTGHLKTETVIRGTTFTLSQHLPADAGYLEFKFSPVFQPKALGMSEDARLLGGICKDCRIIVDDQSIDLLSA